jgi:hypothetical protein
LTTQRVGRIEITGDPARFAAEAYDRAFATEEIGNRTGQRQQEEKLPGYAEAVKVIVVDALMMPINAGDSAEAHAEGPRQK